MTRSKKQEGRRQKPAIRARMAMAMLAATAGMAFGQGEEVFAPPPVGRVVVRGSMYESAAMSVRPVPAVEGLPTPSPAAQISYVAVGDPKTRKFQKNGLV